MLIHWKPPRHGKILALSEEFSSYDKVNVLGKGVTHIAADVSAPEPTVYSVSICLDICFDCHLFTCGEAYRSSRRKCSFFFFLLSVKVLQKDQNSPN